MDGPKIVFGKVSSPTTRAFAAEVQMGLRSPGSGQRAGWDSGDISFIDADTATGDDSGPYIPVDDHADDYSD